MSTLPPGYRTTSALGLTVLWHDAAGGTAWCVTIVTDACPADHLAEIATRDARERSGVAIPTPRTNDKA